MMAERAGRPLLLIDIAVPRDIDAGCGELEGVTCTTSTTCRRSSRATSTRARARSRAPRRSSRRRSSASRAGSASSRCCPRSSALREHGNALVEQVLAENAGRWESASPRDLARIEAVARAVMSRLLHEPTIRLRSLSEERGHASLELVRELFGLREDERRRERRASEQQDRTQAQLAEVHDLQRRRQG